MRTAALGFSLALAVQVACVAYGQPPQVIVTGPPSTDAAPLLLMRPDVQNDLKLSQQQRVKVNALFQPGFARLPPGKGEPGIARLPPGKSSILRPPKQPTRKDAAAILTPAQLRRMGQIELQWAGPRGFLRPDVAPRLQLTGVQRKKLQELVDRQQNAAARLRELATGGSVDAGQLKAEAQRLQVLKDQSTKQALSLLTPKQREEWKQLTGAPFKMDAAGGILRLGAPPAG